MTADAADPVVLAGGLVTAIAGTVPADRTMSWCRPGLHGQLAATCYVLAAEGEALIVDTGLGLHWATIRAGLDSVLAAAASRSLIMTRREPDAIGNLPSIVARYALRAVYCGGVISPLDFFERVEKASAETSLRAIAQAGVTWIQPGKCVRVGSLALEVLPTTLRVLPKHHLYEPRSRTLFGSDSWALLPQPSCGAVQVVREPDPRLSAAAIADDLRHRFDWLAGIDTMPMQREISDLIATRPINRICPGFGCIIEGEELARTVLRNTVAALQSLSGERRVARLTECHVQRLRERLQCYDAAGTAE